MSATLLIKQVVLSDEIAKQIFIIQLSDFVKRRVLTFYVIID